MIEFCLVLKEPEPTEIEGRTTNLMTNCYNVLFIYTNCIGQDFVQTKYRDAMMISRDYN